MSKTNTRKVKVALSMIVKNEGSKSNRVILRCLDSVCHLTDIIAIVDTGSIDDTIKLIVKFCADKKIPCVVVSRPWYDDFGRSRTEALRLADWAIHEYDAGRLGYSDDDSKQSGYFKELGTLSEKVYFNDGPLTAEEFERFKKNVNVVEDGNEYLADYLRGKKSSDLKYTYYYMFMDADNSLLSNDTTDTNKVKFWFNKNMLSADSYTIDMRRNTVYSYRFMAVYDTEKPFAWFEPLHEFFGRLGTWKTQEVAEVIKGGYVLSTSEGDRSSNPLKYLKDALILEGKLLKTPNHGRTLFYAAQSWHDSHLRSNGTRDKNILRKSYELYERMSNLEEAWIEERYYSLYRMGSIKLMLEEPEIEAVKCWLKAFDLIRYRREAAYSVIEYFRLNKQFYIGYALGKPVFDIPPGITFHLFIDEDSEKWRFYDSFSVCCFYSGDKQLSKLASQRCLEYPKLPPDARKRIENNLKCCG